MYITTIIILILLMVKCSLVKHSIVMVWYNKS